MDATIRGLRLPFLATITLEHTDGMEARQFSSQRYHGERIYQWRNWEIILALHIGRSKYVHRTRGKPDRSSPLRE